MLRIRSRFARFASCTLAAAFFWIGMPVLQAAPLASNRPATRPSGGSPVKIKGVSYTEARAWFARLGYKAAYDTDKKTLTLSSGAGRIVLELDSREISLHGLRVFLGEPVLVHKGAIHVATIDLDRFIGPILRPAQVPARPLRTIVIDPGHGGNDTGTQNKPGKLDEKVFTLDVAKRLQRLLGDSGWKVVLTRNDDRFVALPARAEIANKANADLFISIHFNAVANNPTVKGTETYVLTPRFQRSTSSALPTVEDKVEQVGNRHDAWSAVLGVQMHRQLLGKLKSEDRGFKRARFAVLRLVDCPAVLVEAGYLSNAAEARKLASESYRGDIAEALALAIRGYAAALDTAAK
jgi:N-acetylmuramoyl-L-alanine amidase